MIAEDRGPIWRYGMTLHKLHTLPLQQQSLFMILAWGRWWRPRTTRSVRWARLVDVILPEREQEIRNH
ncbi:MAG: hypothetical protein WA106_06920 [Methanothrix sp.]